MQVACSTPFAPVMPLHSCQAAPLNSGSLVFHQQWPLHCLSQLTPHFLSCEVPPGWRLLQVAGEWTTAGQLVCSGCQSARRTPPQTPTSHSDCQGLVYACEKMHCRFVGNIISSGRKVVFSHWLWRAPSALCIWILSLCLLRSSD